MLQRPTAAKNQSFLKAEKSLYTAQSPEDGPIMLVRVNDWQERLTTYINEFSIEGVTCDWEFNTCGSFASGAVREITGYDPQLQGDLTGPKDAIKLFRDAGFESMEQYVETLFVEKPVVFANRGDLVFIKTPEFAGLGMSQAVGIAWPPIAYFLSAKGLGQVELFECTRCFAVGSLG